MAQAIEAQREGAEVYHGAALCAEKAWADGRSSDDIAFNAGPLMNGRVAKVGFSPSWGLMEAYEYDEDACSAGRAVATPSPARRFKGGGSERPRPPRAAFNVEWCALQRHECGQLAPGGNRDGAGDRGSEGRRGGVSRRGAVRGEGGGAAGARQHAAGPAPAGGGRLPLADIEEVGYHRATGFVWLRQKKALTHTFKQIGRQVSYGTEVTAFVEDRKMKRMTGVKSKELLIWITLCDMYIDKDDPSKITFKTPTGLGRTFPVSAFEKEDGGKAKAAAGGGKEALVAK
ncbi:hypothetical protein TRIUR3_23886 [Triticum urartu]|uniref:DUF538 family protein n=1 Tax=Triticum urartu TaxID=4572 RepID=M7YZW0_TRIUA|nr:hypothetical protein TRIUR3_23886 [Triticum urartu]